MQDRKEDFSLRKQFRESEINLRKMSPLFLPSIHRQSENLTTESTTPPPPPPPRNPLPLSRHIHHHSSIAILQDSFKFHWHSYFILRKDTVVAQTSVTEVPWKHIPSDNSHMLFSWTMWNFLGSFTSRITNHLRLAETHFRLIGLQT